MDFKIKPITREAAPAALEKARQYRLLNEPAVSESICLDILHSNPDNLNAKITLLLALTDQFDRTMNECFRRATELLSEFDDDYNKLYYEGIICERRGKAHLRSGGLGGGPVAYEWLTQAMSLFEKAETIRPVGNDEAILRWNSCVRMIARYNELEPGPDEGGEHMLE